MEWKKKTKQNQKKQKNWGKKKWSIKLILLGKKKTKQKKQKKETERIEGKKKRKKRSIKHILFGRIKEMRKITREKKETERIEEKRWKNNEEERGKKWKRGNFFLFKFIYLFIYIFFPKGSDQFGLAGQACAACSWDAAAAQPRRLRGRHLLPWRCLRPPGLPQSMCADLLFKCFDSDRNSVCCLCFCCCCCCCVSMCVIVVQLNQEFFVIVVCVCVSVTDFSFLE